jgi:type IV pilus assembly protein PilB
VLSTLHTNDAPQTLTRLIDMGVKPYAIATSVSLIIAQRLARRLCGSCKQLTDIPAEALLKEGFQPEDVAAGLKLYAPKGCPSCTDGYKGRLGIYQVMPVTEEIGRIIMAGRQRDRHRRRRQAHRHLGPAPRGPREGRAV